MYIYNVKINPKHYCVVVSHKIFFVRCQHYMCVVVLSSRSHILYILPTYIGVHRIVCLLGSERSRALTFNMLCYCRLAWTHRETHADIILTMLLKPIFLMVYSAWTLPWILCMVRCISNRNTIWWEMLKFLCLVHHIYKKWSRAQALSLTIFKSGMLRFSPHLLFHRFCLTRMKLCFSTLTSS